MFLRALILLLLALAPPLAQGRDFDPSFTNIAGTVEAQSIANPNAQLVYWDQAAADALGIHPPGGRVGQTKFSDWAKGTFGVEIKAGSARTPQTAAELPAGRNLFVEADSFGGAGRAAYLKVLDKIWVNLKGVGLTGFGSAAKHAPGPPLDVFADHADGSATLAEAIKEAVYARIVDNDTSRGSSRVIGIIATGRNLKYPDGRVVPEALIIRAPMRRADQAHDTASIVDSFAELGAKRFLKGDFVNSSNIGSSGQLVDFGCLTHTCDYVKAGSSQRARFLREHEPEFWPSYTVNREERFLTSFGHYLAGEMGIPAEHLAEVPDEKFKSLGQKFRALVEKEPGPFVVDFDPVPEGRANSIARSREWMAVIAGEYFRAPGISKEEFVKKMTARQGPVSQDYVRAGLKRDPVTEGWIRRMSEEVFGEAYEVFKEVGANHPAARGAAYADALDRISGYKLRATTQLMRPEITRRASDIANRFAQEQNPVAVQEFIDEVVTGNRLGTGALADNLVTIAADAKGTEIRVRATPGDGGKLTIFSHPELPGGTAKDRHFFRLSTDNWASFADFPAEVVMREGFPEFVIRVPHDAKLPLTAEPLRYSPFWIDAGGETRWPSGGELSFRGPPLFLNERLGLPTDLPRVPDAMLENYGVRVRPSIPAPSAGAARARKAGCGAWFARLLET